jgi:hypothetical protein
MTVKKEEFLALKQGPMSVSEYRDRFLQLSRYAPKDVNTDAKRQYHFLRGLVDPLHYNLKPYLSHISAPNRQSDHDREEVKEDGGSQVQAQDWWTSAWEQQSPPFLRQPTSAVQAESASASAAVSEVVPSASAAVSPELLDRRKSVPEAKSVGTSSSCPSNQPEQSSSPSARRRQSMFPLCRARPLGDVLSKEGSSAAARP